MSHTCCQCKFSFKETSSQFYRRLSNNSPPICQDCSRINKAESAQELREQKKSLSSQESLVRKIQNLKKQLGKISASLIMRKFKISNSESNLILESLD